MYFPNNNILDNSLFGVSSILFILHNKKPLSLKYKINGFGNLIFYLVTDLMDRIEMPPIIENTNDIIKMDENPICEIKIAAITGARA